MFKRHRRLRRNEQIRHMVQENHIRAEDLIYPLFLVEGEGVKKEISSMSGIYHISLDRLYEELDEVERLGIQAIMLFGVPGEKDDVGSVASDEQGIVQRGIRQIKKSHPFLYVTVDTCLCSYTSHGHCGVVENQEIQNDPSLERLVEIAISQAKAGADMVVPSNMMDGFVHAIRQGLDQAGFTHVPILSHATKYASHFYGPFRDAAHCAPTFGDRRSYQMDPANVREAMREAASDIREGADLLLVKPGMPYLDVLSKVRERFDVPLAVYQVSGEYSMMKAAAEKGWINEEKVVMESMLAFKRAGADLIVTYYAKEVAHWIQNTKRSGSVDATL
jgi:porphobilinogen synthase